ncbi:DNA-3-methyladenine glycosylase 2 family protein [Eubacteriales bacterium OttesenSCG-928-A19]|nr:DNA-3-methyladenine glycosylase 2 family protein [Eubacteriales bacterium OttesenSCG-928-A19]
MTYHTSTHFDLRAIADSGQCFRIIETGEDTFELIHGGVALCVEQAAPGEYRFDCDEDTFRRIWRPYFDLDTDYAAFAAAIPPEDAFLRAAAAYGRGVRILRQDPWEMLVTFIVSQRKNIPAIRRAVETLCERYGEPVPGGARRAFPTPRALAACGEDALRGCALGYRAGYVHAAARMVDSGALDLAALARLDDAVLHAALLAVPGVGPKVASCVMLFGFHRVAAFPRDVWINRVIDCEYGGSFPVERYAGYAGVIQQYMFYYARAGE